MYWNMPLVSAWSGVYKSTVYNWYHTKIKLASRKSLVKSCQTYHWLRLKVINFHDLRLVHGVYICITTWGICASSLQLPPVWCPRLWSCFSGEISLLWCQPAHQRKSPGITWLRQGKCTWHAALCFWYCSPSSFKPTAGFPTYLQGLLRTCVRQVTQTMVVSHLVTDQE